MIIIRELDWAPGNYQWDCTVCHACGNVTPPMIREPTSQWHTCQED